MSLTVVYIQMALNSGLVHERCIWWSPQVELPGAAFSFSCYGGLADLPRDLYILGLCIPRVGDPGLSRGLASPHTQTVARPPDDVLGSRCCVNPILCMGKTRPGAAQSCRVCSRPRWALTPARWAPALLTTTEYLSVPTAQIPVPVLALRPPGSGLGFPNGSLSGLDPLKAEFLPALGLCVHSCVFFSK